VIIIFIFRFLNNLFDLFFGTVITILLVGVIFLVAFTQFDLTDPQEADWFNKASQITRQLYGKFFERYKQVKKSRFASQVNKKVSPVLKEGEGFLKRTTTDLKNGNFKAVARDELLLDLSEFVDRRIEFIKSGIKQKKYLPK
jgi:hypothetical protein